MLILYKNLLSVSGKILYFYRVIMKEKLHHLAQEIEGQLYDDKLWRSIYATDASVYREMPLAVCYPKNENDLKKLIKFAKAQKTSLIPEPPELHWQGSVWEMGLW